MHIQRRLSLTLADLGSCFLSLKKSAHKMMSYFQKYLKKSTPYGQKISLIFIYRKMLLKIFSHLWVIQFWVGPLRETLKWSDKSTSSSLSLVVGFPLTLSTGIQERIVIIKSQSKYVWGMPEGNAIFSMGNALCLIYNTHCFYIVQRFPEPKC